LRHAERPIDGTRIAVVQLAAELDLAARRQSARSAIREAVAGGAEIIVLPELASSGYALRDASEAEVLAQPAAGGVLADWREDIGDSGAVVVGGFCERDDVTGTLYNSAALVDETGVVAVHRKIHLWSTEKLIFQPGSEPAPVVETRFGRIGVAICLDIAFPEVARALALDGAQLLALPVACPDAAWPEGDYPSDVIYYRAAAQANRIFVAVSDWCGVTGDARFLGWSVIIDESGLPIAGPPPERSPGVAMADCLLERANDKTWGAYNDLFLDRRPELYRARTVSASASPTVP
jgi:predicted amidohydrolase